MVVLCCVECFNDLIDQIWLESFGEWRFESNMKLKLSEKFEFDVVKSVWTAMKDPEEMLNGIRGIKRKADLSPAKTGVRVVKIGPIGLKIALMWMKLWSN